MEVVINRKQYCRHQLFKTIIVMVCSIHYRERDRYRDRERERERASEREIYREIRLYWQLTSWITKKLEYVKRAAELRKGRRRRGRPSLIWDDCAKRDMTKAGEGGRLEEDDKRQRRVENTIRCGGEEVAAEPHF